MMAVYMRNGAALAALAGAFALSGCGGSSSTVLNPGPNGLPFGQAGLSTAALGTSEYFGVPFTADASRTTFDLSGGTYTNSKGTATATVTVVDADTIRVTIGSETVTLDVDPSASAIPGISGTVFTDRVNGADNYSAVFGRAGSGSSLQSIFFGYLDESNTTTDSYGDAFFVSGFETDPDEVSALSSTATYTGPAAMFIRTTSGAADPVQHRVLSGATATSLTVDFAGGANNVTGTISGATDASIGGGTTTLNVTGTTSGNGFSGSFTKSGSSSLTMTGTEISGHFYGEDAEEIGGTFSADVSAGGSVPEATAASGFFLGDD